MNRYPLGSHPVLTGVFYDEDGDRDDPTDVTLTVTEPDGTVVVHPEADLANPSVGVWTFTLAGDALGTWGYAWDGTGAVEASGDNQLSVGPERGHRDSTCTPWATLADLCTPCDDYDLDPVLLEDALQASSDVLYNLTGRRWPGECTDLVRPCRRECGSRDGCGCGGASEFRLPGYPVTSIDQVKVDGLVVDPAEYRLDGRRTLVGLRRADGTLRVWPNCQRLDLPDTEEGTWSVAYTYGDDPPRGGVRSAATLGCEIAKACQPEAFGSAKCRLPARVTTISRQNITLAVLDPLTVFSKDGLTGLPEVDLWISSVRHGDARRRATVRDPAAPRSSRRTGA